jgi:hypothetical protein
VNTPGSLSPQPFIALRPAQLHPEIGLEKLFETRYLYNLPGRRQGFQQAIDLRAFFELTVGRMGVNGRRPF